MFRVLKRSTLNDLTSLMGIARTVAEPRSEPRAQAMVDVSTAGGRIANYIERALPTRIQLSAAESIASCRQKSPAIIFMFIYSIHQGIYKATVAGSLGNGDRGWLR